MTTDYGPRHARPTARHARPKTARPAKVRRPLLHRVGFWLLVWSVVYLAGAVYYLVRPPVFHLDMVPERPPASTAQHTQP